jgi:hypothetical protein
MRLARLVPALLAAIMLAAPGIAHAGKEKAKAPEHHGSGSTMMRLPTLTTNIPRANGRWGVVTIEAGLDIHDEKLRNLAERSVPRLRAAYTEVLMAIGPNIPRGAQPDLDRISETLQRQTDKVLGRPGAKFLVGSVIVN